MGALPHMAFLAGVRSILVETPWVLVPKGVQVHWPQGNSYQASHDRTTGQLPNGQEDTSGRPGMPGHQPPGMPDHGHQPPGFHRPPGKWARKRLLACQSPGTDHPVTGHWNHIG